MTNNHHKPQQLRMLFSYWKFAKMVAFDILSSQLREVVCQIWSHKGNWHFALKRSLQRSDNFVDHLGPTSDCHLLVSWENIFICNKNSWHHLCIGSSEPDVALNRGWKGTLSHRDRPRFLVEGPGSKNTLFALFQPWTLEVWKANRILHVRWKFLILCPIWLEGVLLLF